MPNEPTRLTSPLIRVLLEGADDVVEVQTRNADLVLWDRTRAKHHWPKFDEAPFLWLTFLAWAALRRTGQIPTELSYEKFEASTLDLSTDDDAGDVGAAFPAGIPGAADL